MRLAARSWRVNASLSTFMYRLSIVYLSFTCRLLSFIHPIVRMRYSHRNRQRRVIKETRQIPPALYSLSPGLASSFLSITKKTVRGAPLTLLQSNLRLRPSSLIAARTAWLLWMVWRIVRRVVLRIVWRILRWWRRLSLALFEHRDAD